VHRNRRKSATFSPPVPGEPAGCLRPAHPGPRSFFWCQPGVLVPRRAAVLLLAVAAVATAFVLPGHPADAVASPTPTPEWVANGDVHAVLEAGGRTYLGGDFDQVGPNTGFGVQLDAATGALPAGYGNPAGV